MHLNRTLLCAVGVVCGLGAVGRVTGAPQAPVPSAGLLPSGDQILAKYEETLGGAAALAKVMTRTVTSRRIVDIGTPSDHVLTRYSKRGNFSIMFHSALDNTFLNYTNGCDGKAGWQSGGGGGRGGNAESGAAQEGAVRTLDTTTGGICEEELAFYGYFVLDRARMRSHYASLETKALTTLVPTAAGPFGPLAGGEGSDLDLNGVRQVYFVLAVPNHKPDPFAWLFFDKQTGVLLRRAEAGIGASPTAPGDSPRYTDFIQYRAVGDGTRSSFQFVTVGAGAARVRGIHTKIVDNAPLDDQVFARPKNALRFDKGF